MVETQSDNNTPPKGDIDILRNFNPVMEIKLNEHSQVHMHPYTDNVKHNFLWYSDLLPQHTHPWEIEHPNYGNCIINALFC